jgi:uncharacterized integral membrane protein
MYLLSKLWFSSVRHSCHQPILAITDHVYALWFHFSQTLLNYLAFQSFNLERTWWSLSQKRVVRTKFNINVFFFIAISGSVPLLGGLLVPEVITHSVVSVSALPWFIKYIYYWNLQFLNNVIISKRRISSIRHWWT